MSKNSVWMRKYRATSTGRAVLAWHNLRANAANLGAEIVLDRETFVAWFVSAIAAWKSSARPAVVRRNIHSPYVASNLELVTVSEASKRHLRNKNTHALDGLAWCSTCQDYRDIGNFSPAPSRPPRFVTSLCKDCKAREARNKRKC